MNTEKAIESLTWIKEKLVISEDFKEAIGMAIEALQDDWIPVSERLPKKNGDYIVSLEDSIYPWGRFFNGKWYMLSRGGVAVEFGTHEVIAWQPQPEPYKGGDTE